MLSRQADRYHRRHRQHHYHRQDSLNTTPDVGASASARRAEAGPIGSRLARSSDVHWRRSEGQADERRKQDRREQASLRGRKRWETDRWTQGWGGLREDGGWASDLVRKMGRRPANGSAVPASRRSTARVLPQTARVIAETPPVTVRQQIIFFADWYNRQR